MDRHAATLALLSAALFGFSTPAAKVLLGSVDPAMLAGLLYCGVGLGVAILRRIAEPFSGLRTAETPLGRSDMPWLGGAIVAGGIVAPVLLMFGLARTDAAAASLLLTFEGAATALLAWLVFDESFNRRVAAGMACLLAGAAVLSWTGQPSFSGIIGPLGIVAACCAWALDSNLTRKVSLADPLQIVELKGLIAGPVNLALGLWMGGSLPPLAPLLIAGLVGFLSYGLSLVLFVYALRHLGSARTGAYFSTAPFFGAVASILVLGEPVTGQLLAAGLLIGLGVWLYLTESYDQGHVHGAVEHTHAHAHDERHRHSHSPGDPAGEPHIHRHRHGPLRHKHPHMPYLRHTHRH